MFLHMLIQIWNAWEVFATESAVGPSLVRLLVIDQGGLAAVLIVASWAEIWGRIPLNPVLSCAGIGLTVIQRARFLNQLLFKLNY